LRSDNPYRGRGTPEIKGLLIRKPHIAVLPAYPNILLQRWRTLAMMPDPMRLARPADKMRRAFVAQIFAYASRSIDTAVEFFDRLNRAGLPEPMRAPIQGALTVLLQDDDETMIPSTASFEAFLSFLVQHRDLPAPSIGVNPAGLFVAGWEDPTFRLSLEFLPDGKVLWISTDKQGARAPCVRDGSGNPPLPPRMRQPAFA
jgi:hypothetical protein